MLKVISKKLDTTKKKVSKEWQRYRQTKQKILKRKGLTVHEKKQILISEIDITRKKISDEYLHYREYKHAKLYKSEFNDFTFTKQVKTQNTLQKIFKAKRNFDVDSLDDIIPDVLDKSNVTGVLVVFEVENEQGIKSYVSNYITKELLTRIEENESTIFEFVTERLNAGYRERLKLKFIYMRIIYANSKKGNN